MKCLNCGHENKDVARFCQKCGQPLVAEDDTAPLPRVSLKSGNVSQPSMPNPVGSVLPAVSTDIDSLGQAIDGWTDLIEGMASKEQEVRENLIRTLADRLPPNATLKTAEVSAKMFGEKRPFLIVEMRNGATIAIYVKASGKDLYVRWGAYIRPLINPLGCLLSIVTFGLWFLIVMFVKVSIPGVSIFKQLSEFDVDDIMITTLVVHKSLLHTLDLAGIQIQTLRIKEQFAAGSQGRLI